MMKRFQLFSFDVVESAAFKLQRSAGDESPQWLESFQGFFEEVPNRSLMKRAIFPVSLCGKLSVMNLFLLLSQNQFMIWIC